MAEKQLRVLVADDIASNRTIVGAFLAHLNCTPIYATDGVEAVQLFRQEAPDVVLMDLMMPRMDGFEAIKQIRAMADDQWVPIIILSALSGEGDVVHGLDIGADDYLTKPLPFPVFAARFKALRRLLDMQRRLSGALEQVRAVANGVIDGLVSADEQGTILSVNRAATHIFGYTANEMVGQNLRMLMPSPYREAHDSYLQRYRDTGVKRLVGSIRELTGVRKDGSRASLGRIFWLRNVVNMLFQLVPLIGSVYGLVDAWPRRIETRPLTRARPGHQLMAPMAVILEKDPELLCHVGYVGAKRPSLASAQSRGFGRGYVWACVEPGPVEDPHEPGGVLDLGFYCCLRPRGRGVGPFTDGPVGGP